MRRSICAAAVCKHKYINEVQRYRIVSKLEIQLARAKKKSAFVRRNFFVNIYIYRFLVGIPLFTTKKKLFYFNFENRTEILQRN